MKKYRLIFFILFSFVFSSEANTVNVRILTTKVIRSFIFSPLGGSYTVYGDGMQLTNFDPTGIFQMTLEDNAIHLKTFEKDLGKFYNIKMIAKEPDASFKIKSVIPESKVRTYDGNVEVMLTPDNSQFLLINSVDLENYIAGVVESEGGRGGNLEYYKIQAILCRTYLLAHLNRHIQEGFEVCDDVHCQAYGSRATEDDIVKAVFATRGLVVVDNNLNLITAAFHSNCGGETCNSEDVWSISTSYLKSVKDTFCTSQSQAHWQRAIPMEDWKEYLQLKYAPSNKTKSDNIITSFNQSYSRAVFLQDKGYKIPLKNIRADFKLKSTFFSIEQDGDLVKFKGRGYGHGVGLCQEGAMEMARQKYSYEYILHYYYKDVSLVDLSALSYFRQE
jgi:stage II sporulation protein D